MNRDHRIERKDETRKPANGNSGYTLIELLGVTAIVVIAILATQGMLRNYKRFAMEETAVQRLKALAQAENTFRHSSDPGINRPGLTALFSILKLGLYPHHLLHSPTKNVIRSMPMFRFIGSTLSTASAISTCPARMTPMFSRMLPISL